MEYGACLAAAGGPPALFGIVILTDESYAGSPGGRPELVVAASSPELQVREAVMRLYINPSCWCGLCME
jgi:hypothetical protein